MPRFPVFFLALVALCSLAVACNGGSGSKSSSKIHPIPGNSELVVGPNRFAWQFIDDANNRILPTDHSVHFKIFGPDGSVRSDQDARFVWAVQDVVGFWATDVDFNAVGTWKATTTISSGSHDTVFDIKFGVIDRGSAPKVGDAAPPAENLTLPADPNIKRMSTDPKPNNAFYQMTVTQALAAQKPFVVVFATPLFCQTQFCGPVLDTVKTVQPDFASTVNFIHIEPYNLTANGTLATDASGSPVAAPPTVDWNLQTEPWVFVVGSDGKVASRFEDSIGADELRAALQKVAGS